MQAIENVSQSYGDSAKLIRFQFIADVCCCLNKEEKEEEELGAILDAKSRYEIAREALRRAEEICKRGGTRNAEIFKTVREKKKNLNELFSSGGNGGEEDVNMENDDDEEKEFVENWSSQMHLENQNEKKRLDEGLTSSKASSLKESIRLAHNDLGVLD